MSNEKVLKQIEKYGPKARIATLETVIERKTEKQSRLKGELGMLYDDIQEIKLLIRVAKNSLKVMEA